jgi:hypothetical protein
MASATPRSAARQVGRDRDRQADRPFTAEARAPIVTAMPMSAWLTIDVAVKVAVVGLALYPLLDPC